jgi:SAM-dependent methyltransferase
MADSDFALPPQFFALHAGLPRQGPGGNAYTRRAFETVGKLPPSPRIVDVGCGPGMQSRELARLSGSKVYAVDTHTPFLRELASAARGSGLDGRVVTIEASMNALPFAARSIDLLWSEGAIYIAGFEEGLRLWHPLIAEGGSVAVTEATWLRPDPPAEVAEFWMAAYPAMGDAARNVERATRAGYRIVDTFTLPPEAWWDDYYAPIEARLPVFRARNAGDPVAQEIADAEAVEIALFRRYSAYYGYVFYVMRAG